MSGKFTAASAEGKSEVIEHLHRSMGMNFSLNQPLDMPYECIIHFDMMLIAIMYNCDDV